MTRCAVTGRYFCANDDDVLPLHPDEALDCAKEAYILIYEKQTAVQQALLIAQLKEALQQSHMAGDQVKY